MNIYNVLRVSKGPTASDTEASHESLISFQAEDEDKALEIFANKLTRWGISPGESYRLYREKDLNLIFIKQFTVVSKGAECLAT